MYLKMTIKNKKGFSLLEFAIAITILSILVAGALSISTVNINSEKIRLTKERMDQINKSLELYVTANGALPCPASLILSKMADAAYGSSVSCSAVTDPVAGSGLYRSIAANELFYGMVPVKTLGLPNLMAEDAWGNKFTYIVNYKATSATSSADGFVSGFGNAVIGGSVTNLISIIEKNGANQTVATDAIVAIISHGANKFGAFGATSSFQYGRPSIADEMDNDAAIASTATSGVYFSGMSSSDVATTSTGGLVAFDNVLTISSANDAFDDIILFKNRNSLVKHLNAVTVPCQTTTSVDLYGTNITWPAANYDQIVVASTACPAGYFSGAIGYPKYPTRRCGAFGVWAEVVSPCNRSS